MIKLRKYFCRKCGYTLGAIEASQLEEPNIKIIYKCKCGEEHNLKEHEFEEVEEESHKKYCEKENTKSEKELYKKK